MLLGKDKLLRKLKKLNLISLVERIPNQRVVNYILPRLYYYFKLLPKSLVLDIVSRCNAACPFCPKTILAVKGETMSEEIFYQAVNEAKKLGIKHCRLYTTGEPLLHPKFSEFVTYLHKNNFSTLLSTNGQFLNRHFEALSLIDEIKISIEGWDKESFEYYRKNCKFEVVHDNLKRFKEFLETKKRRPFVIIGCMVMRETNLEKFYETWGSLVDRIDPCPTIKVFRWKEKKIDLLSFDQSPRLKENIYDFVPNGQKTQYCGELFETVYISPLGNGFICCNDFTEHFDMGNIMKNSLLEIIRSRVRREGQKQFVEQKLDACEGCTTFNKLDENSQAEFDQKVKSVVRPLNLRS